MTGSCGEGRKDVKGDFPFVDDLGEIGLTNAAWNRKAGRVLRDCHCAVGRLRGADRGADGSSGCWQGASNSCVQLPTL